MCRKRAVPLVARCSSRTRKDSRRVGPIEEEVEDDSEKGGPVAFSGQYSASSKRKDNIPIQSVLAGKKPMLASTQTAQDVILYTKTRGK